MAFFIVKFGSPSVRSDDWSVAVDDDGLELRWTNGAEAAAHAKLLNDGFKERGEDMRAAVKREADPSADVDWRARANERFASGHWEYLPWSHCWWTFSAGNAQAPDKEHYAHVARGDATKVAFYASTDDGAVDRLTVMTPGRYLARYFGPSSGFYVISEQAIGDYAAEMGADANDTELHFATTADEFEDVYTNGPSSCMSYTADDYSSPMHPVRIYAAGDLQLAYLTREGNIIARALCWPERLLYGRTYGDDIRLTRKLKALGYNRGSLDGARMQRVETDGTFVAPYIDGSGRAHDNGEYLVIDCDGEIMCCNTDGLAETPFICPHCHEAASRDDCIWIGGETREYWCSNCASDDAFYCEECGNHFANDDREAHTVNSVQQSWNGRTYEHQMTVCDRCVEDFTYVPSRGEYFTPSATFTCEHCGDAFVNEDEHAHYPDTCTTCGEALDDPSTPMGADEHPDQLPLRLTA